MARRGIPRRPANVSFGDRSWVDVQNKVATWAHYRYPRIDKALMEEALQDAVVDGMTYWQSLPSSHSDDVDKNFNFAVYRGKQFMLRHIPMLCNAHMEVPYDSYGSFWDRADSSPTPDEVVEDLDLLGRARAVLDGMPAKELEDVFDNLLSGESASELGERLGITQQGASKRRSARTKRARATARKYGLYA